MTAAAQTIRRDVADGILTITLDRPDKLNAYNQDMRDELIAAFDAADADDDVRAVIVTGAGRAFCAGADLEQRGSTFDMEAYGNALADGTPRDTGGEVALRILASTKPVIAAINGPAVGIGITMTLAMDFRLAAEGAKIGFVFARRGIVPEACSTWFLPRLVGLQQALEWTLTARIFRAEEALAGGLVRSVHVPGELLGAARALAAEIAAGTAPVSVALTRRMLYAGAGAVHPLQAHETESRGLYSRGRSEDVREGVAAFLDKRPAAFPDRVSAGLPDIGVPDLGL